MTQSRTADAEPATCRRAMPGLIAMPGEHPWPELEDTGVAAPHTAVDDLGNPL